MAIHVSARAEDNILQLAACSQYLDWTCSAGTLAGSAQIILNNEMLCMLPRYTRYVVGLWKTATFHPSVARPVKVVPASSYVTVG